MEAWQALRPFETEKPVDWDGDDTPGALFVPYVVFGHLILQTSSPECLPVSVASTLHGRFHAICCPMVHVCVCDFMVVSTTYPFACVHFHVYKYFEHGRQIPIQGNDCGKAQRSSSHVPRSSRVQHREYFKTCNCCLPPSS